MDPRGQGQCRLQDCERDMGLVDDPESGWLEEIGEQFYKVAQLVVEEVHLLTVFWKSVRPPPCLVVGQLLCMYLCCVTLNQTCKTRVYTVCVRVCVHVFILLTYTAVHF